MRTKILFFIALIVILSLGSIGLYERLTFGHRLTAYGSYAAWGLWVASYIYFIGLSAGAFLFSSLIYVFNVKKLEKIGKLSLYTALVTLILALLIIWFDIGHMDRFWEFITRPNFNSMMNNMIYMYTAYFIILLLEFLIVSKPSILIGPLNRVGSVRILSMLGAIGVPLATLFHGGVGALFAVVGARPYWFSALFPVLFLAGALLSGGALLTFFVAYLWTSKDEEYKGIVSMLGRLVLFMLFFYILFEWAEFSIPWWAGISGALGVHRESALLVLTGPFWWVFWVVHILFGVLIPLALLTSKRSNSKLVGLAGLLISLTFMGVRLNSVIPGAITVELKGLEEAFQSNRLVYYYFPTLHEWLVLFFVVGVGLILMYVGVRFFGVMKVSKNG
ncbi:MAG: NrfD/PsrC family molybdoenzyme membrane anchor subunit [Nitrososphaerales archaeon]